MGVVTVKFDTMTYAHYKSLGDSYRKHCTACVKGLFLKDEIAYIYPDLYHTHHFLGLRDALIPNSSAYIPGKGIFVRAQRNYGFVITQLEGDMTREESYRQWLFKTLEEAESFLEGIFIKGNIDYKTGDVVWLSSPADVTSHIGDLFVKLLYYGFWRETPVHRGYIVSLDTDTPNWVWEDYIRDCK